MVPEVFHGPILHALRLMKFLSVRNRASGPGKNKKKGGPARDKHKPTSWPVDKLTSLCYRII